MDTKHAIEIVLDELRRENRLTNSRILQMLNGNESLLLAVRESLILDDFAEDKNGVGLAYRDQTKEPAPKSERTKLFLSYGRLDAKRLADRLLRDLTEAGFDVWLDTNEIKTGKSWQSEITDGLRSTQVVIALLSPHSVRTGKSESGYGGADSVCLSEISYALFTSPPMPVIPVMAANCEPPLAIFHLDYVDLTRWQDSEQQYQDGLRRLIEGVNAAIRGEKKYRSWHHQLRPWDFAAFLHEKRKDFTGREWLFDELDAWRMTADREKALLITGDPGTGKSAFVAQLVHANPDGQVIAYHCCQSDTPATLEAWRFVRSIAAMIASRLPAYATQLEDKAIQELLSEKSCRDDPAGSFEQAILAPLESLHAPPEGARILLVDALDESLAIDRGVTVFQLLASRINRLPSWLRLVATSRKEPEIINRLKGLRAHEVSAQDPRNQDDVAEYVQLRLNSPNIVALISQSQTRTEDVLDKLLARSKGNFLYARHAIDSLESGLCGIDELESLPAGLFSLYEMFFRRHFGEQGEQYDTSRRILEVIVAAREPLNLELLAGATKLNARRELPFALKQLAPFVPKNTDANDAATYSLFHKSLAEWLTTEELLGTSFSVLRENGHERLAEYGILECNGNLNEASAYSLTHLPIHLIESNGWDELESLLTNLSFLEQCNTRGMLFELVRSFRLAIAAIPAERPSREILRLINEALWRDLQFIARHADSYPQALFQSLWNSGWWYDSAEAAHYLETPEGGWGSAGAPWERPGPKMSELVEQWRLERERRCPQFTWLRERWTRRTPLGSAQMAVLRGHEAGVFCVSFSPDGTRIVSGSGDRTIRIWDRATGVELNTLRGHDCEVRCVAYSSNGSRIASGSTDKTVRIWDSSSGEMLAKLDNHESEIIYTTFIPNSYSVISISHDGRLVISDVTSEESAVCVDLPVGNISCAAYFAGKLAITYGHGQEAFVLDLLQFECVARFQDGLGGKLLPDLISSLAFSPTDGIIASGIISNVAVWTLGDATELATLQGHTDDVRSVYFSPDGKRIVSSSDDRTVRVWDLHASKAVSVFRGHHGWVMDARFSPDGQFVVSAGGDKTVRVWDANRIYRHPVSRTEGWGIQTICYSPCGSRFAIGCMNGAIRILDSVSGKVEAVLHGHKQGVLSLAFSPDGDRLASGSLDNSVRIWCVESGDQLVEMRGHDNAVQAVAFSPDGARVASGSADETARIWDAHGGEELHSLHHEDLVYCLDYSPDGTRIATGTDFKRARIWDANCGELLNTFQSKRWNKYGVFEEMVIRIAYNSDGTRIVIVTNDDSVEVWDSVNGDCLEVVSGFADAAAFILAEKQPQIRTISRYFDRETVVESTVTREMLGVYPEPLAWFQTHPSGRQWTARTAGELTQLTLEGGSNFDSNH